MCEIFLYIFNNWCEKIFLHPSASSPFFSPLVSWCPISSKFPLLLHHLGAHVWNTVFLYQNKLWLSCQHVFIPYLKMLWMIKCEHAGNGVDPRPPYITHRELVLFLFFNAGLILCMNGLLVTNILKPEPVISVKVWAAFRLPKGPFRASSTAEQGSKPSSSHQN